MGVLTDYFRAPDDATVLRALTRTRGGSPLTPDPPLFDGIEAKSLDPTLTLALLIAAIREVPWSVDLIDDTPVWPTTPPPTPDNPPSDEDPWSTGPWTTALPPHVRDTLATLPDTALPAAVTRWSQAEELHGTTPAALLPLARNFVSLARQARAADEQLYCWMCL